MGDADQQLLHYPLSGVQPESHSLAGVLSNFPFLSPLAGSRMLIERVLECGMNASSADRASIMLADAGNATLRLAGSAGLDRSAMPGGPKGPGLADLALQNGRPLAICNDHLPEFGVPRRLLNGAPHCSVILPLRSERRIVGVLNLAKLDHGAHFSPDDVYRAAVLASAVGPGIEAAIVTELLVKELASVRTLSEETNHRLLNNLSDVIGILQLQSAMSRKDASAGGVDAAIEAVQAMITTSMLLREQSNEPTDFAQIGWTIVESFRKERGLDLRGIELSYAADLLLLPPTKARSLSIILIELLTNCVKHGFGDGRGGVIAVNLRNSGANAGLTVHDNGMGLQKQETACRESLGLRIIKTLAKRDLRGTVEIKETNPGCLVEITFPL
jgi:two-component sensor histidine kinase